MMDTDDLLRLHQFLRWWQNSLTEGTDAWAHCNLVLLDVNQELLNRKYDRRAHPHMIEPA